MSKTIQKIISEPSELRSLLLQSVVHVIEGKMSTSQANAIVGLSTEVHKSIKQQWDMQCYASENLVIENAEVLKIEKQ